MTEAARVLLTAVIVSAAALGASARRIARASDGPERLVAQLHLSHWAALVLVVQGGLSIGLAVAHQSVARAPIELILGLLPIAVAMVVLRSEPVRALWLAALGLGLHAGVAFAHRPGWLSPEFAPAWFWLGQVMYDLYTATLCSLGARNRS